jgi:hypothetical protein
MTSNLTPKGSYGRKPIQISPERQRRRYLRVVFFISGSRYCSYFAVTAVTAINVGVIRFLKFVNACLQNRVKKHSCESWPSDLIRRITSISICRSRCVRLAVAVSYRNTFSNSNILTLILNLGFLINNNN